MDLAQAFNKFRDRPTPSLSDDGHGRALRAAAARAATLEDSTPTRTHAHHTHRRGLLYLRREAHGPRTDRPCVPLASDSESLVTQLLLRKLCVFLRFNNVLNCSLHLPPPRTCTLPRPPNTMIDGTPESSHVVLLFTHAFFHLAGLCGCSRSRHDLARHRSGRRSSVHRPSAALESNMWLLTV